MGFRFKQFQIDDSACAMKVGTDSIILGSMAEVDTASKVLDIGCGSGLLSLMLAQRTQGLVPITGVELDSNAVWQARENIRLSPWPDSVVVVHADINDHEFGSNFDLIIANPPYFIDSLQGPDQQRNRARHSEGLTQQQLIKAVVGWLSVNGSFWLILPKREAELFIVEAQLLGLALFSLCKIHSLPGKTAHRYIMAFRRRKPDEKQSINSVNEGELVIYDVNHHYSSQFIALTRNFYLNR